jgi:hypothetical protein
MDGRSDRWTAGALERLPAAARLIEAGADRADLVRLARAASYDAVFTTLDRIDEGYDADAGLDASLPGWRLMETDGEEALTGRDVGGLHESILMMDPSGREGGDLWR